MGTGRKRGSLCSHTHTLSHTQSYTKHSYVYVCLSFFPKKARAPTNDGRWIELSSFVCCIYSPALFSRCIEHHPLRERVKHVLYINEYLFVVSVLFEVRSNFQLNCLSDPRYGTRYSNWSVALLLFWLLFLFLFCFPRRRFELMKLRAVSDDLFFSLFDRVCLFSLPFFSFNGLSLFDVFEQGWLTDVCLSVCVCVCGSAGKKTGPVFANWQRIG